MAKVIHYSKYLCMRGKRSPTNRTTKQNEVTCKHCLNIIEYRKVVHYINYNDATTTVCGTATRKYNSYSPAYYKTTTNKDKVTCPGCITKLGLDTRPDIGTLQKASQSFALGYDKKGWYLQIKIYCSGEEMQVIGDDFMDRHPKCLLPPPSKDK